MAPVRTKTLAKKACPANRKMWQALSITRFRALRAYRFTWRDLKVMADKALHPKRLERLVILSSLMNRVPFQVITNTLVATLNLETKKELEKPSTPPTIILTTPDGEVIPFDKIPPGRKCHKPKHLREMHQEWLNSGLLCPLHAGRAKKVRRGKTKKPAYLKRRPLSRI